MTRAAAAAPRVHRGKYLLAIAARRRAKGDKVTTPIRAFSRAVYFCGQRNRVCRGPPLATADDMR